MSSQKIVSLVPALTEILFFLGLADHVVGVTEHCNYPEEAINKTKVGLFAQPDKGKILSLCPDLVLADKLLHADTIHSLQEDGLEIMPVSYSRVDGIFELMESLVSRFGADVSAMQKINVLRKRMERLSLRNGFKKPRTYFLMTTDTFITPGPASVQYDAMRLAGARLMESSSVEPYIPVSWEEIVSFDPEVIIYCGVAKGQMLPPRCKGCLLDKPNCQRISTDFVTNEWSGISAVRTGRMYPLPCHAICRPGPRMVDGMEMLQAVCFQLN